MSADETGSGTPGGRLLRLILKGMRRLILAFWPYLLVVGAWQAWVTIGDIHRLVAPPPIEVFDDVITQPSAYLAATWRTVLAASLGLLIGTTIGVTVAIATWRSLVLRGLLTTSMILVYSAPIVATIPLMTRIMGYSGATVLAVAALVSMFPTFVLVTSGLRSTPAGADDVFAVLGARHRVRLIYLAAPSAMPNFFMALRLNAAVAFVAAIIGEYLTGVDGLGSLFADSFSRFKITRAWGASILIVVFSILSYAIANRVEERGLKRWT